MTPDEVSQFIFEETRRRGYERHETVAVDSTGRQESGLRQVYSTNRLWFGIFQQDTGYTNRMDPRGNVLGFLDRLDVKRRSPGASPDIWKNIFWLQQRPSEPTAEDAYRNGRQAYLTEIQRHITVSESYYDKFSGGSVAPAYTVRDMYGSGSSTRSRQPINFFIHTEEGNSSAEQLARYCDGSHNVSYHYTLRDGILYNVVPTERASWSVLDANAYSVNLCFAGSRSGMTRQEWLAREHDIDIAAYIAVRDARRHGFSTEVIAPPYGKARPGISDHKYVTQVLGIGTHTDVGNNFPWDRFAFYVNIYAGGPVPNAIDEARNLAPWLGTKLTGELPTPDGRGRFASYENGHIYWTPTTGARPIPKLLFESYAKLGYEAGPLGYPVREHTVIPDTGDIQAFEGGILYRKYGQDGFYVRGAIGAQYARTGYEKGPLGWPTANEITFPGGASQDYEGGVLIWSASGVVAVRHPAVLV